MMESAESSDMPNIPVGRVRSRWNSLPRNKKLLVVSLPFFIIILTVAGILAGTRVIPLRGKPVTNTGSGQPVPDSGDYRKLQLPGREPPFFSLTASTVSRFGILPQEVFVLKTRQPVDESFVRRAVQTSEDVSISSRSPTEYAISPVRPLGSDKLVTIRLAVKNVSYKDYRFDRDYGWSFQTQGKFRVVSYLPGDKKQGVPVETGIEIVFSQDDYRDPARLISVEPAFEYRLERHAETLAIVPLKPLIHRTVYTVTLKKGLDLASRGDPIPDDFSFSFQTIEEPVRKQQSGLRLDKNFVQVAPGEALVAKVFTHNWQDETVQTRIYQFPDSDRFLSSRSGYDRLYGSWMMYYPENEKVSSDGLSLVSQSDLKVSRKGENEYLQLEYLTLPKSIPPGFYLVQFSYSQDKLEQLWLQVTDVAGYVAVGEKKTTFWANLISDGQPAKAAGIRLVGGSTIGITNDQGFAVFDTPKTVLDDRYHYLEISVSGKIVILPVLTRQTGKKTRDDYWSYFYHERQMYLPTDTVYFWGVVKNRDSGAPPSELTVSVVSSGNGNYEYDNSQSPAILTKTVSPSSDGTYIGNINYADIPPGWYYLSVRSGNVEIESAGFQVLEYVKPDMKIEVSVPKKAIYAGEKITMSARVTFFDGTPADNISVNMYQGYGDSGGSENGLTDKSGAVSYVYQPGNSSTYPGQYHCITFAPALATQSKTEGQGCVFVLNYRLLMESEGTQDGNQAVTRAKLNHVDPEAYNSGSSDAYRGEPARDQKVTLTNTKTWWDRVQRGTYYDFVEKVTRPQYNYVRHDEKSESREMTSDTGGNVQYNFTMEEKKSYKVHVEAKDKDGKTVSSDQYYYYYAAAGEQQENRKDNPELTHAKAQNIYSLGEDVRLSVRLGDKSYPDTEKNRFLYIIAQRGNQEAFVTDNPAFTFVYEDKHLPNVYAGAVVFTGRYYQLVYAPCLWEWSCYSYYEYYNNYSFPGLNLVFRKEDRNLQLDISYDKSIYKPGQQVSITVDVRDKDERPASGARVSLVLVDEALAALGGVVEPDILPTLYTDVRMGIYYSYHTHEPVFPPESQAEMGGGGGGDDRTLFRDTAVFEEKTTDSGGKAVFSFEVPDNITSWRVYGQAVTGNLFAGQAQGSLVVSKDFFVVPGFPRDFLAKDQPVLTGSAFGKALVSETRLEYQAEFLHGGEEFAASHKSGQSGKVITVPFPTVTPGEYSVSLAGTFGELQDKVTLPFRVIGSRFSVRKHEDQKLDSGQSFKPAQTSGILADYPYSLVVSDGGKGKFYWQLASFCNQSSNRLEKVLSQITANRILLESFGNDVCPTAAADLTKFQSQSDGGLGQVWWGASNLETSAWAAYIDSSAFDQDKLAGYFKQTANLRNGGSVQKIYSAWGLSSLGKPQVLSLKSLADKAVIFEEKVLAGLALAAAGETERAKELYLDILADHAYEHKPYLRIQSAGSGSTDKLLRDTGLTLLLGYLVDMDYNDGLYAYMRDYGYESRDLVGDLGVMAFVRRQLSIVPAQFTSVTFTTPIRTITREMKTGGSWATDLAPQERNSYNLTVDSGKAEVTAEYFLGPEGMAGVSRDPRLKVTRSYRKVKGTGDAIFPGDIVEVSLEFDFDYSLGPRRGYTLTDILPSGLSYLDNPSAYGLSTKDWVTETQKNVISYSAYNDPWWLIHHDRKLQYFARASAVGTYISEPAVFQSDLEPQVLTYTPSQEVVISQK